MRLIHVNTLEMHGFHGDAIPPYAILSHRWGRDELLLKDFDKLRTDEIHTDGANKVRAFCDVVRSTRYDEWRQREGVEWAWVDTCCIDKSSSAELSEAINSMYQWYSDSVYCVACLKDVHLTQASLDPTQFRTSEWFTRGWCLQELLAPRQVIFCDDQWKLIGTKIELGHLIEAATGIDKYYLLEPSMVRTHTSVAQRMSWASKRRTTRVEDMAYSLLGIFGINMPLLYGEGDKAFQRLQEQIIDNINDCSILAWHKPESRSFRASGALACHHRDFTHCGNVFKTYFGNRVRFQITGGRLEITARMGCIRLIQGDTTIETVIIPLNCVQGVWVGWDSTVKDDHQRVTKDGWSSAMPCMLAFQRHDFDSFARVHAEDLQLSGLDKEWEFPKESCVERTITVVTPRSLSFAAVEYNAENFMSQVHDPRMQRWRHLLDNEDFWMDHGRLRRRQP